MQAIAKRVNDETGGLAVVDGDELVVSGLTESEYIALTAVTEEAGIQKDASAFPDSDTKWKFVPGAA